jgi:hypothetical protein
MGRKIDNRRVPIVEVVLPEKKLTKKEERRENPSFAPIGDFHWELIGKGEEK